MQHFFANPQTVQQGLLRAGFLADKRLAATVFLAGQMQKPLLVEGPAGVGKTYLARALARALGAPYYRLQCYPGLDESKALYEWNYQKQLLYLQTLPQRDWTCLQEHLYSEEFLLPRPVLRAFLSPTPAVLLIDEVDKSDEELESFLLEALGEYQVSIPEYGPVQARHIPLVILTSNNRRELSDALKRRCLHLYIDFPTIEQEQAIVRLHLPDIPEKLLQQCISFIHTLRKTALRKPPGLAESIDWARALLLLGARGLNKQVCLETLGILLKYEDDVRQALGRLEEMLPREQETTPPREQANSGGPKLSPEEEQILARFNF
ncbi:MAG: AAA family ATPase [Bacillota bacterium]|uniref:AAA family ATPase n=1 Tax=Desulfurispora thermophila TaxID=265470 RepID=UPI00035DF3EF|nr:MoxR family ATPase [Desulfurispora thermophila]